MTEFVPIRASVLLCEAIIGPREAGGADSGCSTCGVMEAMPEYEAVLFFQDID